ncbi:hypothetical protein N7533_010318 [Penicillium manginii]|uniref:uncharacterized protein n=1 Tax=Penicillium manginii TaxID=203109 RepID=UPI0025467A49|nr:uncharacterized protein N7533_010318 [Penicillium manginii]KAJ5743216.1 hypothetical protein N7533_010318 [Penicillium manginii]
MDAMENILQVVERGEATLAGVVGLGRNPNPILEIGVSQEVGQFEEPSQTSKVVVPTEGPANGAESEVPQVTTNWASEYSETSSSELPQYIPHTPTNSDDNTRLDATQQLTSSSESESGISAHPETLTSSTITTSLTTSSSTATTTITTSSSSSSSLSTSSETTTSTTQSAPTESPTDTAETSASKSSSSTNTKLAIALPVTIVGLLIIAVLTFFFLRRRRRLNAKSEYNIATGQTRGLSTAELMALQKVGSSGPAVSSMHHLPVIQVPQYQERAPGPGSAMARAGLDDSHTELGLPVAVPLDQRRSAPEQDLPRFSGSASRTSTPRMPFESRGGADTDADDDDNFSFVSGMNERRNRDQDFDDMSSVSSFEDDENEHNGNGHHTNSR